MPKMTQEHAAFPGHDNLPPPAPGETPSTGELGQQYPAVRAAMDALNRVATESADAEAVQHTEAGEPIMTPSILNKWGAEMGFHSGKRGTFRSREGDMFLYNKYCHEVPVKEDIDETLATARYLTERGAIHPESQWGVYARDDGIYQLFVVSPALEPWLLEEGTTGGYRDRPVQPTEDRSHIMDWFERIDPNFTRDQPIPPGSPLFHLNYTEASHPDNWGWDKTGALYPVDVEVIRPHASGVSPDSEPWVQRDSYTLDDYSLF